MSTDDPATYLKHARRLRALGDVAMCKEMAAAAYQLAHGLGDGETVYRARAVVGHLFYYRAEYLESYEWYRAALREAESWRLTEWLGPAHHDCWRSGTAAGLTPDETNPYGAGIVEGWGVRPDHGWRFIHDYALRRDNGERERARFLASAAVSASWRNVGRADTLPEYDVYAARFERMVVCASMVRGYGGAGLDVQWRQALDLFDHAAGELGTTEGYGLCLLEVAEGCRRMAAREVFRSVLERAACVVEKRGEPAVSALVEQARAAWTEEAPASP